MPLKIAGIMRLERTVVAVVCDFCGHALQLDPAEPLEGMDPGTDGKVDLCVRECFCSYGGCRPERTY